LQRSECVSAEPSASKTSFVPFICFIYNVGFLKLLCFSFYLKPFGNVEHIIIRLKWLGLFMNWLVKIPTGWYFLYLSYSKVQLHLPLNGKFLQAYKSQDRVWILCGKRLFRQSLLYNAALEQCCYEVDTIERFLHSLWIISIASIKLCPHWAHWQIKQLLINAVNFPVKFTWTWCQIHVVEFLCNWKSIRWNSSLHDSHWDDCDIEKAHVTVHYKYHKHYTLDESKNDLSSSVSSSSSVGLTGRAAELFIPPPAGLECGECKVHTA